MAAPSRNETLVKELVEANVEGMKALTAAVASLSEALASRGTQVQAIHGNIEPIIRFEDLPEDDWDKPERLWKREDEEDKEFTDAAGTGEQVDTGFLAEVLAEAGLNPDIKLN